MQSINIFKLRAKAAIDQKADEVRRRFVTDIAGQQAVYLQKLDEARLYVAAHASDPLTASAGPHLMAEASELNSNALTVSVGIIATGSAWLQQYSPAIEGKRVGGKAKVDAATTEMDIASERDAAVAALNVLMP